MAQVELINVSKVYPDGTRAVDGISMQVAAGEMVVLVGPSGCGKSTALRMVAGLEEVTAGEICIGGKVVNNVPPKNRDIAMVFQNYALYPHMSVRENLAFALRMRKVSQTTRQQRVDDAAEMLGIESLLDRKPAALSGGQQQRVALGRAIVREPACFLFDEPLSNLDAKMRVEMRAEIKRLHQRLGATSIFVTHDQEEAMMLADRLIVMRDGRAEQCGTPEEVYQRPANRFVAGFMGLPPMNFIDGRVVNIDGLAHFQARDIKIPIRQDWSTDNGQPVTLGIRPGALTIRHAAQGEAGIPATVDVVDSLGDQQDVYLTAVDSLQFVARVGDSVSVSVGDEILAVPDVERIHLFDTSSDEKNLASIPGAIATTQEI